METCNSTVTLASNSIEFELFQEELLVGTSADFPPFEFLEPDENGVDQIVGFDIEVAKAIADEIGVNLVFENRSFPTLFDSLENNELDFVIAALNETPERLEVADFSEAYYQETIAILSNNNDAILEIEDLANRTVGAQTGSSGVDILEDIQNTVEGLEIVTFDGQEEILSALETEEIEAAITVDVVAEFVTQDNPSLTFEPVPELGGFEAKIAFPKGSPLVDDFNDAIADLRENGVLEDLEEEFFNITAVDDPEEMPQAEFEPNFGTVDGDILEIEGSQELVFAGSGNDLIDASNSQSGNRIYGGSGDDTFILGRGDILFGGEGEDRFFNQAAGENRVTGGADTDQFWIAVSEIPEAAFTITDFELDVDVIGIVGIGALSVADLSFSQEGDNTIIGFDGNDLAVFQGVDASNLEQSATFTILA